jgi:hypothetical protein
MRRVKEANRIKVSSRLVHNKGVSIGSSALKEPACATEQGENQHLSMRGAMQETWRYRLAEGGGEGWQSEMEGGPAKHLLQFTGRQAAQACMRPSAP